GADFGETLERLAVKAGTGDEVRQGVEEAEGTLALEDGFGAIAEPEHLFQSQAQCQLLPGRLRASRRLRSQWRHRTGSQRLCSQWGHRTGSRRGDALGRRYPFQGALPAGAIDVHGE